MSTLTDKVERLLRSELNLVDERQNGREHPLDRYPCGALSYFEEACREWGVAYGLAYGLARSEDPSEAAESVAKRALKAAHDAYEIFTEYGEYIFTSAGFDEDRSQREHEGWTLLEALKRDGTLDAVVEALEDDDDD